MSKTNLLLYVLGVADFAYGIVGYNIPLWFLLALNLQGCALVMVAVLGKVVPE